MEACELLTVELRLDRIDAELAAELPAHLRSFARAHAAGARPPPAPAALSRAVTLATARAAIIHPVLADRGLALLRLAAPLALESDPAVTAARSAPPTWPALAALSAARDAAALARFGRRAIDVTHRLHGTATSDAHVGAGRADLHAAAVTGHADPHVGAVTEHADAHVGAATGRADAHVGAGRADARVGAVASIPGGVPPPVAGWREPDGVVVDDRAVVAAWEAIRARHGLDGTVRFERAEAARPRAFVVQPGREVIVVIPARLASPADRFAVLHELGHVVAALALPAGIPRVVDEAVAAWVARAIERDTDPWHSPLAVAARARRLALARALDAIERALPALPAEPRISERPPWALWHDPGAQAAYVAAEALADEIDRALAVGLGAGPAAGALAVGLGAGAAPDALAGGLGAGAAPGALVGSLGAAPAPGALVGSLGAGAAPGALVGSLGARPAPGALAGSRGAGPAPGALAAVVRALCEPIDRFATGPGAV